MHLNHIEQSASWAKFQKEIPTRKKAWKIGKSFIYRHILPFGYSWLDCPRGKLSAQNLLEVKKIARHENSIFLRLEPPCDFTFPQKFHKKAHAHHQPETTLILDLKLSEKDMLEQMKSKGRYNIHLAQKKGLTIRRTSKVTPFIKLLEETTKRDGFHSHPKEYYQTLLTSLKRQDLKNGFAKLFVAEFKGEPIAALIATFYKNTATYYFGASSNRHRNLMAPYLLQWEAIRYAISLGLNYYDFLGIAPDSAHRHPWRGVTAFKKKFGGTAVNYPPAREFVFRKIPYYALVLAKKLRKLIK